jgi:hypothetical protein
VNSDSHQQRHLDDAAARYAELAPSLRDQAMSVAPSAQAWLRASRPGPFGDNRTILVAGPGLGAASAEVRTLAQ